MSYDLRMPQLTQTMSEATIICWHKREGDPIRAGELLLEVMTDKANVEVESPVGGVLGRILVAGGEVAVGVPIAVILAPGEALTDPTTENVKASSASVPLDASESAFAAQACTPVGALAGPARRRVSPRAKRLAEQRGIDLERVVPTGPAGLITESDVRRHLELPPSDVPAPSAAVLVGPGLSETPVSPVNPTAVPSDAPPSVDGEEVIPLLGLRKIIAERVSLSRRTAADVTTVAEVDMSEVSGLRERMDITYTAFVARAVAQALTEFPILNSMLQDDRIIVRKRIHLGVAVATDGGLLVPVVRDAHTMSLRQIGLELADLAKRGSEGHLNPDELTGSTFTLTNSGVFGSLLFTPIINPPESGIVGMGKIVKTPVVRDNQIVIRKMMYLCLTYDHRVVDGAYAVRFLQRVKALLEEPQLLLGA